MNSILNSFLRIVVFTSFVCLLSIGRSVWAETPKVDSIDNLKQEVRKIEKFSAKQAKVISILIQRLKAVEKKLSNIMMVKQPASQLIQPKNNTQKRIGQEVNNPISKQGKVVNNSVNMTKSKVDIASMNKPREAEATRPGEVKRPPMKRSMEAVLSEGHSLFRDSLIIETGLSYSRSERQQISLSGFLALDAIFIGEISVDEVESDIVQLDITPRYGFTDRFEMDLNIPFLYRTTTFRDSGTGSQDNGPTEVDLTLDFEMGDVSLGMYYKLFSQRDWVPDIIWNMRIKAPTGTHPFGTKTKTKGDVQYPGKFPSGNGIWAVSTGLSFVKSVDPVVLFSNLTYFYNFEETFSDLSTQEGQILPGAVKLGDSFQFGLGMAIAFNERTSFSISYSHLFTSRTKLKPEGGSWSKVFGSSASSAQLNFGLTYAITDRLSMVANVAAGLTPDAPDVQVGVKFPYAF